MLRFSLYQQSLDEVDPDAIGLEEDSFERHLPWLVCRLVSPEDFKGFYVEDQGAGTCCPLMLLAMLGFGGWWFTYAIDRTIDNQNWHIKLETGIGEEPHVKFVGKQLADNKLWRDECGACHAVFYPALLPTRSWQKIMAEQDKHFGSDLGFDAVTTEAILKFMVDNAAEKHVVEAAFKIEQSIPAGVTPLRVTETPYWLNKHREIAASDWANPLVQSKSNCAACHADADDGTFEDGAMHIPKAPAKVASAPISAPPAAASKP